MKERNRIWKFRINFGTLPTMKREELKKETKKDFKWIASSIGISSIKEF